MAEVVVGVDGSQSARKALRWAAEYATAFQLPVRAVSAFTRPTRVGHPNEPPPATEELRRATHDRLVEMIDKEAPDVEVVPEVVCIREGNAAHALCDAAKRASLLVVGSRGLGGFTGLLVGSVSQQCVQYAPCPVVVVREREDATA